MIFNTCITLELMNTAQIKPFPTSPVRTKYCDLLLIIADWTADLSFGWTTDMTGMAVHEGLEIWNLQLLSKMFKLTKPQTSVSLQVSPHSINIKNVF